MLPTELKGETHDIPNSPLSSIAKMRVELQMHLLDCYEIIYWPWAVNVISSHPHISQSLTPDPISLTFARKALSICIDRINKSATRYRQRQYGSWLILRRSTRSALLLLAAYLTPGLRDVLPTLWREAVGLVVEMLRFWAGQLGDVAHRLEILERLVRNIDSEIDNGNGNGSGVESEMVLS